MIWEQLYEYPDNSILHVSREADEGWNYALYHRCSVGEYTLADGGYIDNAALSPEIRNEPLSNPNKNLPDPIDEVASIAAQMLGTSVPVKASLTVNEFQEYIKQVPDMTYRGVDIFLTPELKKAGIEAVPEQTLTEIRQAIDRRLCQNILLMHDPVKGYVMHFVSDDDIPIEQKNLFFLVILPDTCGCIYAGDGVDLEEIGEYDEHWALRLWLDPVYIELRAGKFVFDID